MTSDKTIWVNPPAITITSNEATVEVQFVLPLLDALGYGREDVSAKHPVKFQAGREVKTKEADFAVFDGQSREQGACLLVVEAKRPGESLEKARCQAESYAVQLRALAYVVTDGGVLEVWQYRRTGMSEKVVDASLSSLAESRANIEAALGRESLRAYRLEIREPRLHDIAWNIAAYEAAEVARVDSMPVTVERMLGRTPEIVRGKDTYSSDQLCSLPSPLVIWGRSGTGKSSVCRRMFGQALQRRRFVADLPIPIHIPLPQMALQGVNLRRFAFNRVFAHCPAFTESMFDELIQTVGLDLYCDAFDRVPEAMRSSIETDLELLIRDSPRSRIVIFSRPGSIPQLQADALHIYPLNFPQQRLLEEVIRSEQGPSEAVTPATRARRPFFIEKLAGSPLILSRAVSFHMASGQFPKDILELFRFWLEAALRRKQHKPTTYERLSNALTVISLATWHGAATASEILAELGRAGLPSEVLDELVSLGVVTDADGRFEVEHEALADYLRAKALVQDQGDVAIPFERLDRDSFFPVLLVAFTRNVDTQRKILAQMSPLGMETYLNAVRFRGVDEKSAHAMSREELVSYVADEILEGFLGPARLFFPNLLVELGAIETGVREDPVRVEVSLDEDLKGVEFSIVGPGDAMKAVRFRPLVEPIGDAREVGMEVLRQSLDTVISNANLIGGKVWHEERLLSRLRLLLWGGARVERSLRVKKQLAFWEPHRGQVIEQSTGSKYEELSVDDILADLEELVRAGIDELQIWWNRTANMPWWRREWDKRDASLQSYYERLDIAYAEVVKANFEAAAGDLSTYLVLPRSWEIFRTGDRDEQWLTAFWHPVRHARDVCVKITYDENASSYQDRNAAWFDGTVARLAKLGRRFKSIGYSNGILPTFSGRSPTGPFDGKTAVLRQVCLLLQRELQGLFTRSAL